MARLLLVGLLLGVGLAGCKKVKAPRPSAQEARATIVLSAGKTATPLASAAAVLARFGRGRLERELSDRHTDLSSCRWGLRQPMPAVAQDEPEHIRDRVRQV